MMHQRLRLLLTASYDKSPQVDREESDDEMGLLVYTPPTMTDAPRGPVPGQWRESPQEELASTEQAEPWNPVDNDNLPAGAKPIDSRLVLAIKTHASGGQDHKLKTPLCAKAFTQRHGID